MPIEIDVNDPTPPTPCKTEGCGHPRFHVCTFGKPDLFPALLGFLRTKKKPNYATGSPSAEAKKAMSESQQARWARFREENRERDEAIVARYNRGDIGMHGLAEMYEISSKSISKILHEAQAAGKTQIRKVGETVRQRNVELERRVIELYKAGGLSVDAVGSKLGISRDVARKILLRGQREGLVTIRPRGHTIAKGAA